MSKTVNKKIFIIRHCEAKGQEFHAPLTENGKKQAVKLAKFLSSLQIDRIISSPYVRATQTIEPFSELKTIPIEIDPRLKERVLSTKSLSNWLELLAATFDDKDLKFEGGESSREAQSRIVRVIDEIMESTEKRTAIVAHGNIIALLLHYYNEPFGFEEWKNLSNPDVYQLQVKQNDLFIDRIWKDNL